MKEKKKKKKVEEKKKYQSEAKRDKAPAQ